MKSLNNGFTLIELIVVIIIIGIVSVAALPKLSIVDRSSQLIEARDRLLNLLRHTQLQSMQDTQDNNSCDYVLIRGNRFGQRTQDCHLRSLPNSFSPDYLGYSQSELDASGLVIKRGGYTISTYELITFDTLGRPLNNCVSGCRISLTINGQSANIYIEAQGYIHL